MSSKVLKAEPLGPAMMSLNPKQQAFVMAMFEMAPISAAEAARVAGYGGDHEGSARVQSTRLMHRPDIKKAMIEYAQGKFTEFAPAVMRTIQDVATNPQHKDAVKAAFGWLNRSGLHEVVERNVNINVTMTREEKIAEIRQLAEEFGKNADELLGNLTDAEYSDITEGEDNPFADEEY